MTRSHQGTDPPRPTSSARAYAELIVTDLARVPRVLGRTARLRRDRVAADAIYLRGYDELPTTSSSCARARSRGLAAGLPGPYRGRPGPRGGASTTALGCRTGAEPAGTTRASARRCGSRIRSASPSSSSTRPPRRAAAQRYDLGAVTIARLDHFNIVVPDVPAAYEYYQSLASGCRRHRGRRRRSTPPGCTASRPCTTWRSPAAPGRGCTTWASSRTSEPGAAPLRHPRLLHEEAHIERGPGRHGVSNAFYVYLRDPDGHRVEIYTTTTTPATRTTRS